MRKICIEVTAQEELCPNNFIQAALLKSLINIKLQVSREDSTEVSKFLHTRYILANSPLHMMEGGQPSHPDREKAC